MCIKFVKILSFAILGVILFTSCNDVVESFEEESHDDVEVIYEPIVITLEELEMLMRENDFAARLFVETLKECKNENIVISPLSLSTTLSMSANIADGATQTEIINVLGFDFEEIDELNGLNAKLAGKIGFVDSDVKTTLANSIWASDDVTLKDDFVASMKESYGAEIYQEDLSTKATMNKINAWAFDKTSGLIPEFLNKPYGQDDTLVFINALHFSGSWYKPFEKAITRKERFTNADSSATLVDMMNMQCAITRYAVDDTKARWLSLYFGNKTFSISFILPNGDADEYFTALTNETCNAMFDKMRDDFFDLYIPRLDVESTVNNYKDVLNRMGINKLFADCADLSEMTETNIFVNQITQKTRFILEEEGVRAASVTDEKYCFSDLDNITPEFRLDRPFAFIIREEATGVILFMGRINKL